MTRDELRSVLPGGKWHEVAMEWVAYDAAVLQCAHIDGDIWQSVIKPPPSHVEPFCADRKWRIKPQVLRYRVALMRYDDGIAYLQFCFTEEGDRNLTVHRCFRRWACDWQEVEL